MIIITSEWQKAENPRRINIVVLNDTLLNNDVSFALLLTAIRNTAPDTMTIELMYNENISEINRLKAKQLCTRLTQMLKSIPAHITHLNIRELDKFFNQSIYGEPERFLYALQAIEFLNALPKSLTHMEIGPKFFNAIYDSGSKLPSNEELEVYQNAFSKLCAFKSIKIDRDQSYVNDRFKLEYYRKLIESDFLMMIYHDSDRLQFLDNYLRNYSLTMPISNHSKLFMQHPGWGQSTSPYTSILDYLLYPFILLYQGIKALLQTINNFIFGVQPQPVVENKEQYKYTGISTFSIAIQTILSSNNPESLIHLTTPLFTQIQHYIDTIPIVHTKTLVAKEPAALKLRHILIEALKAKHKIPTLYVNIVKNLNVMIEHMLEDSMSPQHISSLIAQLRSNEVQEQLSAIENGQQKALRLIDNLLSHFCSYDKHNVTILKNESLRLEVEGHIMWLQTQANSRYFVGDRQNQNNDLEDNLLFLVSKEEQQKILANNNIVTQSDTNAGYLGTFKNMLYSFTTVRNTSTTNTSEDISDPAVSGDNHPNFTV